MFKVSFKEQPNNPSKAVKKMGKVTTVYLRGYVRLPEFFYNIPSEIADWMSSYSNKVEIYENVSTHTMVVISVGESKCREDDKYDTVLGERIAESRAKHQIYKFFYVLTCKLCNYYEKLLFGPNTHIINSGKNGLTDCMDKYKNLCIKEAHHLGELLNTDDNG